MADTDITVNESNANQIDIKVATANDFIITANKFEVQASSVIDMNGQELILDADADTSITSDTDDQIDVKIAGADDFVFTTNKFTAAASSGIVLTKTAIASDEATSAGAVTSNNFCLSHTLTQNGALADDAVLADVIVTSDKVLATSTVIGNSSLDVAVRIHTVVAGSFKVSITNVSGAELANDSTMILNYVIL